MPASPHRANHGGLPILFAVIGGAEARLDDAVRLARPAAMAGTEMPLTIAAGMQHIFSIRFGYVPTSRRGRARDRFPGVGSDEGVG